MVNRFDRRGIISFNVICKNRLVCLPFFWTIWYLRLPLSSSTLQFSETMLRQISLFLLIITLINTLIYLLVGDVSGRFNGISTSAAFLGFNIERPLFYFSNGVNHYGILLGFFICFLYLWFKKMNYYGSRVIRICILTWLLSQFFLLIFIIDSRGALLSIFVGLIFNFFSKSKYMMYSITLFP